MRCFPLRVPRSTRAFLRPILITPDRLLASADVDKNCGAETPVAKKRAFQGLAAESRAHMPLPEANAVEHGKTG